MLNGKANASHAKNGTPSQKRYWKKRIKKTGKAKKKINTISKPLKINQIEISSESRMDTGDNELNRVLGGGSFQEP